MSKSGVVGTFGGINIPPVTAFMDGFYYGVAHHNSEKGTDVQVLGWNPMSKEGLFTGNFESLDDGRAFAQNLYDEGADIVMPVAGPVGLGSAALADELGTDALMIVGVDADQTQTDPDRAHVYLTSVLKRMDSTVKQVIKHAMDGKFEGGLMVGTLANGGVGLAPYHHLDKGSGRAEGRGRGCEGRADLRQDQRRRLILNPMPVAAGESWWQRVFL